MRFFFTRGASSGCAHISTRILIPRVFIIYPARAISRNIVAEAEGARAEFLAECHALDESDEGDKEEEEEKEDRRKTRESHSSATRSLALSHTACASAEGLILDPRLSSPFPPSLPSSSRSVSDNGGQEMVSMVTASGKGCAEQRRRCIDCTLPAGARVTLTFAQLTTTTTTMREAQLLVQTSRGEPAEWNWRCRFLLRCSYAHRRVKERHRRKYARRSPSATRAGRWKGPFRGGYCTRKQILCLCRTVWSKVDSGN